MKLKGLFMSAAILAPMAIAPMGVFADEAPATSNSKVMAEVVSGGLTISAKDVDFGKVTIGTTPEAKTVADLLTVHDLTGGNGFEVSVKAENYADTKDTMLTKAKLESETNLTDASGLVQTGESMLAEQTFGGTVSGEWGATPKAGAFSQDLVWTATAKAAPEVQENADFADLVTNGTFDGNLLASELQDSSGVSTEVMLMADGRANAIEKVGDTYVGTVKFNATDTSGNKDAKEKSKQISITKATLQFMKESATKNINEYIQSVEAPFGMDLSINDIVEDQLMVETTNSATVNLSADKNSADVPFTINFKDGTSTKVVLKAVINWM